MSTDDLPRRLFSLGARTGNYHAELHLAWEWPGNVRELENFIERPVILTHGKALEAPPRGAAQIEQRRIIATHILARTGRHCPNREGNYQCPEWQERLGRTCQERTRRDCPRAHRKQRACGRRPRSCRPHGHEPHFRRAPSFNEASRLWVRLLVGLLRTDHSQLLWNRWRGRRDSNPRPLP